MAPADTSEARHWRGAPPRPDTQRKRVGAAFPLVALVRLWLVSRLGGLVRLRCLPEVAEELITLRHRYGVARGGLLHLLVLLVLWHVPPRVERPGVRSACRSHEAPRLGG